MWKFKINLCKKSNVQDKDYLNLVVAIFRKKKIKKKRDNYNINKNSANNSKII